MNIYELVKQATPGPWDATPMVMAATGQPTNSRMLGGLVSEVWDKRGEADAILAAHCRNNFMRALEAVKRMHEREKVEGLCGTTCDACKLIAELEKVK